ncbi:MAG: hypothetical protein M3134_08155, partial [Actinomycetota bacterium]|nr:hypothetical protein [Actinomycetota bacterium]
MSLLDLVDLRLAAARAEVRRLLNVEPKHFDTAVVDRDEERRHARTAGASEDTCRRAERVAQMRAEVAFTRSLRIE